MKKIHILFLLLTFGLIGCKRDVDEDRPNYYGDIWEEQEKERQEAYARDIPLRRGITPVEADDEPIEDRIRREDQVSMGEGGTTETIMSDIPKPFSDFNKEDQEVIIATFNNFKEKLLDTEKDNPKKYYYIVDKNQSNYNHDKENYGYEGDPYYSYSIGIFSERNHTQGSFQYVGRYLDIPEELRKYDDPDGVVFNYISSQEIINRQMYKPLKTANYDPFKKETDD